MRIGEGGLAKDSKPNESDIENNVEKISIKEEEAIKLVTAKEVTKEIESNVNPQRAPGYDLITGEVLKKIPEHCLTNLINVFFRHLK